MRAAEVTREIRASVKDVWTVLDDGWLYPLWVVGAARMRDVDSVWPEKGSQLHHSVGNWPLLLDDTTEVLEVRRGHRLVLQARGWPAGEARVVIDTEPSPAGAVVSIREDAVTGPWTVVPKVVRQLAVAPRNRESLRRLAYLAERRASGSGSSGSGSSVRDGQVSEVQNLRAERRLVPIEDGDAVAGAPLGESGDADLGQETGPNARTGHEYDDERPW